MTREEAETIMTKYLLRKDIDIPKDIKEAMLVSIKDMHTMVEIEDIVGDKK